MVSASNRLSKSKTMHLEFLHTLHSLIALIPADDRLIGFRIKNSRREQMPFEVKQMHAFCMHTNIRQNGLFLTSKTSCTLLWREPKCQIPTQRRNVFAAREKKRIAPWLLQLEKNHFDQNILVRLSINWSRLLCVRFIWSTSQTDGQLAIFAVQHLVCFEKHPLYLD